MIASFLINNLEIIVGLLSFGGMGIYMLNKDNIQEDNSNDLTELVIKNKKHHKKIAEQVDGGFFGFKK